VFIAALPITQHISVIFSFLPTFIHLYRHHWDARIVTWVSIFVFLLGYLSWEILECVVYERVVQRAGRQRALKSTILVFLFLLALSPVLRTLTASTSSDSIWALSTCLFILNVLLADYTAPPKRLQDSEQQGRFSSVLSMNAAISASVILASRLEDDTSVFALMLSAVQMFVLFPMLRTRLQNTPSAFQLFLTASLSFLSLFLTLSVSAFVAAILLSILLFVTFGAPAVLVWAQKYKNEIRGPWDVAVPRVQTRPDL